METIRIYLENLFRNLPKTEEMERMKNELFQNMEEKYHELKREGKLEKEAIGIVISEFGNIDELLEEMNIKSSSRDNYYPILSFEEANEFIAAKAKSSKLISMGVALILLGVSLFLFLYQMISDGIIFEAFTENAKDVLPIISLVFFVAPAVGFFIHSRVGLEKYKHIREGLFKLSPAAKATFKNKTTDFASRQSVYIIVGVCLFIISPVAIYIGSMLGDGGFTYGVSVMLILVAVAIWLFINGSSVPDASKILLKIGKFEPKRRKQDKLIGTVAEIVWPIALCIFLFTFFVFDLPHAWIVFPITGLLFGVFSVIYSSLKAKR